MPGNVGQLILSISMIIATVWIVNKFWGGFFEKRELNGFSILVWIAFCALQLYFEYNKGNVNVWATVLNILLIFCIVLFGYKSEGKSKYFLWLMFCSVWSLTEMFVFFVMGNIQTTSRNLDIIGTAISKIIIIIAVYLLAYFWRKKKEILIPNTYLLLLLFIPFGSIFISISEFYSKESASVLPILTLSILLLFNVGIFELYIKINEIFTSEKERMAYAQQIDAISQNLAAQKKMMEGFHEEKHNLINKIVVLKNALENDERDAAVRNLNKIIKASEASETISHSGNSTVDAIINFKYALAKEYGIQFHLNIFIPEDLPIKECDLGVVVGNAIDNAIDATKACTGKEKIIEISMGVKKGSWVMRIRNPFEHALSQDRKGNFISTKEEGHLHGFGLSSIEKIADQYEGESIAKAEDGYFVLTILMNLRGF